MSALCFKGDLKCYQTLMFGLKTNVAGRFDEKIVLEVKAHCFKG